MTVNPAQAATGVEDAAVPTDLALTADTGQLSLAPTLARSSWRGFVKNWNSRLALVILFLILLAAILSALGVFGDPANTDLLAQLKGPSAQHIFGTDNLGRDIFARTTAGLRLSLIIGFCSAAISLVGGVIFGTLAAMAGKRVDRTVSTFVDMAMAFPHILLAVVVVSIFGAGPVQLIIALGFASIPAAVRLQRSMALTVTSSTYMDAARMANAPLRWNLFKHMLPNTLAPMTVVAAIYAADAILAEAGLSYLGLGIVEPTPSLGNIIADGQEYLQNGWWISAFPGLMIVIISLSLHFLSDGIREQLDPALRKVVMVHKKERSWLRRLKG
jgi:peptide/nickel transport system permease protein